MVRAARCTAFFLALLVLSGCRIAGIVTDANGIDLAGVTVALSGNASLTAVTDSQGQFLFDTSGMKSGTYVITPSLTGARFLPSNRVVRLAPLSNSDGNDFIALSEKVLEEAWPMHPIDSRFRGANALMPGDVNKDGCIDYVTNYEFSQRYVIALHPGAAGKVRQPWPTVVVKEPKPPFVGQGIDPEHAALGDFDGDGNLDVAGAQGYSERTWWEGSEPGVRIIWGPPAHAIFDPSAWIDAGRIPATIDRGHFIYVTPFDVNGDGATDIVSGGRIHAGNQHKGGVIWIEAPADSEDRRDLSQWQIHDIDPDQYDAHGLLLTDVDQDGDMDIVLANADFDTPESEEKVLWYENVGTGSPAQKDPWPIHVIYQGSEFYAKPQVVAADLNGDGRNDLLVQTEQDIYYFKKTGLNPVTWERIVIRKDPVGQWLARTLKVADLNHDGKLDIFGMLFHKEGTLPGYKAAAFWMEYTGAEPRADNWTTHVIKWGSGRTMVVPVFGEKWDQADVIDVDGDGDLDIVANCEEWWEDGWGIAPFWDLQVSQACVAVVWFENRINEAPYAFAEKDGLCVMEAEHYTALDGTWVKRANYAGYTGDGYVQDFNAIHPSRSWNDSDGLRYALDLQGGTYAVWLRRWVPEKWGWFLAFLGGSNSNSVWIGIDGMPLAEAFDGEACGFDAWTWIRAYDRITLSPGTHVVYLRVCEGGYAVDKIIWSADPAFAPSGAGPDETPLGR